MASATVEDAPWWRRHWFGLLLLVPWIVFAIVWFIPLTAGQPKFGSDVVPVASCPAPYYYVTHQSGFARSCDVNALGRVMLFGAIAVLLTAVPVLVRAAVRDVGKLRRESLTTKAPIA